MYVKNDIDFDINFCRAVHRFASLYLYFITGTAVKSSIKPPTSGMTPIYLEPKPEPYLVHHLEGSQSCASNVPDSGTPHSSALCGSPLLGLSSLSTPKHENESTMMKLEGTESVVKSSNELSTARSTSISNTHELTNMQPAPPSAYTPYSPIQYNGVGV